MNRQQVHLPAVLHFMMLGREHLEHAIIIRFAMG
jgi:hypothetical protein